MRICGLDPSSTSFGVALLEDEDLIETAIWTRPRGTQSAPTRLVGCYTWLVGWLMIHRPDMASIEFLSVERNAQVTRVVSHYQAIGALACKQRGLMVVEGRVMTARSIVFGDGHITKEDAYKKIKKRFPKHKFRPFDKGGSDESDAVIMGLAGPQIGERS